MNQPHSTNHFNILIVEDNNTMREGMVRVLEKMGHVARHSADGSQALTLIQKNPFHLMVTDYKLPGLDGISLLQKAKEIAPEIEVLVITAFGTIELAVDAVQKGAADFITKPFSPEELALKVNKILERVKEREEMSRISEENVYLRDQFEMAFNFGEIVGNSPVMKEVYRTIEKVAKGESSVIIYGESGTGKELIARRVHELSPRGERPFVSLNCGAFPETLLESELFGYVKGAFTGAGQNKQGLFQAADGGTLFLDEIGEMSLPMQVKLLRVLQEWKVRPLGSTEERRVDVRLIAATNKDLRQLISEKIFREDLFYRISVIPLHVPPLRERLEDIPLLALHFLQRFAAQMGKPVRGITPDALAALRRHDWPGNVRELENAMERAMALETEEEVSLRSLPEQISRISAPHTTEDLLPEKGIHLVKHIEQQERAYLLAALNKAGGVRTKAAVLLGMSYRSFRHYAKKYKV